MMRALVLVLAAGCLGRPQPHSHTSDGNSGDGDSNATADADPCGWQGPVPIVIPVPAGDALAGPWLDNARSDLWYTQLPNGSPPGVIAHATFASGSWSAMLFLDGRPTSYENPFYDEKRNSLWIDKLAMGESRHLVEYPLPSGPVFDHPEVTAIKAPSLTPDGSTLYTTAAGGGYIFECAVAVDTIQAGQSVTDPVSIFFEAPSVTSDGSALYVTAKAGIYSNIYVATLTAAHDGYTDNHIVGTFQISGKDYFDPNISRDGTTLVFASNFEGGESRLYYVTRPDQCVPH